MSGADAAAPASPLERLCDELLTRLAVEEGLSARTVEAYANDLRHLRAHLSECGVDRVEAIGRRELVSLAGFLDARGMAASSRARVVVAVRRLLKYAQQRDLIGAAPLEALQAPRGARRLPRVLHAEQTAALLPALQKTADQTSHALSVLVGQAPSALSAELAATSPVPAAPDDLALAFPAETLRQRADVRAAEFEWSAARARVSQAEAARWPSLSLGGSLGLVSLTLGSLIDGSSLVSSVLGSVTGSLFDGGAARAQVGAQQAALEQSLQDYRAVVLIALRDVEDALVALRSDRERLVHLKDAADGASNAAALARQQYGSGLVDFQTVLLTERTQLGAQDEVASASADVSSDYVRLYKALGGGWTPDDSASSAAN